MTTAFTPPRIREDFDPVQDFDLCDITIPTRDGRKRYCGAQAVNAAIDVDGRTRLLCADHVAVLFPGSI